MSKVITDQNSACRSARHEKHRSRPAELYIMPKYPVSGSDKKIARTSQLIARFTKANARYSQRKKTSTPPRRTSPVGAAGPGRHLR